MAVRIGFLGTGFMGQLAHLHNYAQVNDCQIAAVAEARPKLGKLVAKKYGIDSVYESHEELLCDKNIDAVICSQPYRRNHYLGTKILNAGKHLFTEKPMTENLTDAQELVALAKEKKLIYAVGYMKRFDPGIQLAQKIIADFEKNNELGELRLVDTSCFLGDWLQNPGQPITTDEPVSEDDLQPRYPDFLKKEHWDAHEEVLNIYSHNINLLHFLLPGRKISCQSAHNSGQSFIVAFQAGGLLLSLRGTRSKSPRWEEQTILHFERDELKSHRQHL